MMVVNEFEKQSDYPLVCDISTISKQSAMQLLRERITGSE